MIDTTNPRGLADQIRALWDKVKDISGHILPATTSATAGQILGLTGENKTPAWIDDPSPNWDYSETEVNTGKKWINGKDIYMKVITGVFPVIETSTNVNIDYTLDGTLIDCSAYLTNNDTFSKRYTYAYTYRTNQFTFYSVSTGFSEATYYIILYYTKPDPTRVDDPSKDVTNYDPAPVDKGTGMITGEDPEPETKTTKSRKSTK